MAKSLEMVDRIGLSKAKQIRLLKQLKAGKSCDLYEVRTNSCTARAYSFLVERKEILVIAFIEQVTHSGTGKKGAQRAIKKLESNRHSLNEALKGYENG